MLPSTNNQRSNMSYYIYPTNSGEVPPKRFGAFDPYRFPATRKWVEHYSNIMLLTFIHNHQGTSLQEKYQANKELEIAQRKLAWCERQPLFNKDEAARQANAIKKQWSLDRNRTVPTLCD